MAEVIIKWCPNMPRTYKPVYASSANNITNIVESETCFSNCIESLCAAYKSGECKMFGTSVYKPVKDRE